MPPQTSTSRASRVIYFHSTPLAVMCSKEFVRSTGVVEKCYLPRLRAAPGQLPVRQNRRVRTPTHFAFVTAVTLAAGRHMCTSHAQCAPRAGSTEIALSFGLGRILPVVSTTITVK